MRKRRKVISLGLAVGLLLLLGAGCIPGEVARLELTIMDSRLLVSFGNLWEITGEAVNTGNVEIGYVEIWAFVYNESDDLIGKVYTNNLNIAVGATWHFMIYFLEEASKPDSYRLEISELS